MSFPCFSGGKDSKISVNLYSAVFFPDFHPPDFPAYGLRQFVRKFYYPRVFVRCCHLFYMILQFLYQFGTCFRLVFLGELLITSSARPTNQ